MQTSTSDNLKPRLLAPGENIVGGSSPVVQALAWVIRFFANDPMPNLGSADVRNPARGLATHLIHLLQGASLLNLSGWHSVSASLLRSMEDALDCFAAVIVVPGAAEKWSAGQLRPSDAAKAWTPLVHEMVAKEVSLSDYRRLLREKFNDYAHCSPELCAWNLFFLPRGRDTGTGIVTGVLEVNLESRVIASNAHALDAHCTGHLLEFLVLIRRAYSMELRNYPGDVELLNTFVAGISRIMMQHAKHGCQEVRPPPEMRRLQFKNDD